MKILTFDIEDWYNCDFSTNNFDWSKFEVRLYSGADKILFELNKHRLKGTFFCLGWIAENHPDIIRNIASEGHHIGCHSYQHQLSFRFNREQFKEDTLSAKLLIEDITGFKINAFRAPGFSITQNNTWAFEVLAELGFEYDCSIFPANHDYGGYSSYGKSEPTILELPNAQSIKEFPVSFHSILGKNLVFSGGGFFRLFPYFLIKKWGKEAEYIMTYFHPRDFDPEQPVIKSLPLMRKFKSYYGLKYSFPKFQRLLNDFEFLNIEQAANLIDWDTTRKIKIH